MADVYTVAKFQKYLLVLVLVNIFITLFVRSVPISLVMSIITMYFIYQIGTGLKMKYVWLWLVGMLIPLLSLILILVMNSKATSFIRKNGFTVGLLGAKITDIKAKLA